MSTDGTLDAVFRAETSVLLDEVEARLLGVERGARALEQEWRALLGALHTIKGNCGMVERTAAETASHALEHTAREVRGQAPAAQAAVVDDLLTSLDALRALAFGDATAAPTTRSGREPLAEAATRPTSGVHIPAAHLDELLELGDDVASLLDRLTALGRRRPRGERTAALATQVSDLGHDAARRAHALRRAVMNLRLVSLRSLLGRFDRPIRELARHSGKQVDLRVRVGELAIDKQVAERLSEPLLHILRNAVDHGLEPPRARARAGKPELGAIEIAAEVDAGRLLLTIRDDGRGLDLDALRAAAAARGHTVSPHDRQALLDLVFAADLSTSRETTTLSGRGVGLDQSRRALEAIGGAIEVASERGRWTEFRLRAPLALALQRALVVRRGDILYAVPFRATVEVARIPAATLTAAGVLPWRGNQVPLVAPPDQLTVATSDHVVGVVVARGGGAAAIAVDDVLGYQDVTIRELHPVFGRPRGVAGAALLVDGTIALVLDPDALDDARPAEAA